MTAPFINRRGVLAGGLGGTLSAVLPASAAEDALGAIALEKGLKFGASFATHELDAPYGDRYAELYKRECRIITSELEFKLASLRPSADVIEFGPADRFMTFAETNALAARGHTLIWQDALPPWINRLGPGEASHLLEAHIETVMERYSGRVAHWDVVNEPIGPWDKLPGNLRGGVFYAALGEDYIARSFQIARRMDPKARLVLNEAQTESSDDNGRVFRQSFLDLVKRLLDRGTPIDAIGLESHLMSSRPYDYPAFAAWLQEIAALGLEIQITELDVNDDAIKGRIRERDARVAAMYRDYLGEVLQVKAVSTVVTWQLADHTSWLRGIAEQKGARPPRPLPYDAEFRRKPAWFAIAESLRAAPAR